MPGTARWRCNSKGNRGVGRQTPARIEAAIESHHGVAKAGGQAVDHVTDTDRHAAIAEAGKDVQKVTLPDLLPIESHDSIAGRWPASGLPRPGWPQPDADSLNSSEKRRLGKACGRTCRIR